MAALQILLKKPKTHNAFKLTSEVVYSLDIKCQKHFHLLSTLNKQTNRQTNKQTNRQTNKQTNKQTDEIKETHNRKKISQRDADNATPFSHHGTY